MLHVDGEGVELVVRGDFSGERRFLSEGGSPGLEVDFSEGIYPGGGGCLRVRHFGVE